MGVKKIRGGALVARALKDKGIDNVFTLSGGFCNPALEGFMECQINVINCPHEQIAGHLADGHTRITRKPSVCIVGPEGFLVILVCPSAICPAICSWGQFITSIWHSINPSSAGLQKPPDKVKTCLIPLSFKALAIKDPPLIFFSDI